MSDLVSKVLAGGLSAALFLFWWPTAVPGSGPEWLLLRGILWALVFELLLLSFGPLERAVTAAIRARRIRGGLPPRQGVRVLALALAGLAVPAALMHGAQPQRAGARAATPPAKERVIVKREIVRREVVIKRVNKIVPVTVPGQTTTVAVAATPARQASTATTRTRSTAAAKTKAKVVVKAPATQPATTPASATPSSATPAPAGAPAPATKPAATSTAPAPAATPAG